jgi:prevent-host-death family protein
MSAVHSDTYSHARAHLKELLDAAEDGRPATVNRDSTVTAVVDANRLRHALSLLVPARAEVVKENDGWSVMLPGLPIAADGNTFDEAMDDMVDALREYADDWADHLLHTPNHRDNWGLVQLITLSSDALLRAWLQVSGHE